MLTRLLFGAAVPMLSWGGTALAADPVFDPNRLHEVRLAIDPEAWRTLQANYLTDDYYVADITLEGRVFHQVGIRSRGSGSRNPVKPGLKVDLNKYVAQDLNGIKTLVLRNQVQDASYVRERLAFAVFAAAGIAVPQNAFARFYVNDEYRGLYEVEEAVTKPFLKARFGEDAGNLFEYQWVRPYDFSFLGADPSAYAPVPFEPKTNENKPCSDLVDFVSTINGAPDATFVADMASWLDLDQFLRYLAVENAIVETDGLLGSEGMNNFYLYQLGGQRRFVFIPWDKDQTLHESTWPVMARVDSNVLVRRLLSDPTLHERYLQALSQVASDYVNRRWLLPQLEAAYAQIREAALADDFKPFTDAEFELAIGGLRSVIIEREGDVLAQTGVVASMP